MAQAQVQSQTEEQPLEFTLRPSTPPKKLSHAEAVEIFASIGDTPYQKICLNSIPISETVATVVADQLLRLANRHSLIRLSMADCFPTLGTDEASRAISVLLTAAAECTEISFLDLSRNALGTLGISACAPLLQSKRHCLRKLYLSKSGLGADAVRILRSFLATRGPTHLEALRLDENKLAPTGINYVADIIEVSPLLKELSLIAVEADPDAVLRILTTLAEHTSALEYLDLSCNACDRIAALGFANVFCANISLRTLILRNMNLRDEAAHLLLRAVASAPIPIQTLDVSGNELSSSCAAPLADCVNSKASTLRMLCIGDNELGDMGATKFVQSLSFRDETRLDTLSLALNGITDIGALSVGTAVVNLPHLSSLDLSGNEVSDGTVRALKDAYGTRLVTDDEAQQTSTDGEFPSDVESSSLSTMARSELAYAKKKLADAVSNQSSRRSDEARHVLDSLSNDLTGNNRPSLSRNTSRNIAQRIQASTHETSQEVSMGAESNSPFSSGSRRLSIQGDSEMNLDRQTRPRNFVSSEAVVSSARELRAQVTSLDIEVSNLVEQLQTDARALLESESGITGLETTTVESDHRRSVGKSFWNDTVDIIWAFICAAFVLMILVRLIQSQDEFTFSLKPI